MWAGGERGCADAAHDKLCSARFGFWLSRSGDLLQELVNHGWEAMPMGDGGAVCPSGVRPRPDPVPAQTARGHDSRPRSWRAAVALVQTPLGLTARRRDHGGVRKWWLPNKRLFFYVMFCLRLLCVVL